MLEVNRKFSFSRDEAKKTSTHGMPPESGSVPAIAKRQIRRFRAIFYHISALARRDR
jgi:hypothetical protein